MAPTSHKIEIIWVDPDRNERCEVYGLVILAVSPDIVAAIFEPLKPSLGHIPTVAVKTVAHTDTSTMPALYVPLGKVGML